MYQLTFSSYQLAVTNDMLYWNLPEGDGDLLGGCVVLHGALSVQDVAGVVVLLPLGNVGGRREQLKRVG